MSRRRPTLARALQTALRRLARDEAGSFLVEALASSLIIVIVGLGVLESIDRSAHIGSQQETQAVAGNVAQSAQEAVRALPLSQQSNLRSSAPRTVNGTQYTVASRTDWVTDASGDADCTTPGAGADYMKLTTVVTWPQMERRSPVKLESIITPGVRSLGADQGSLAVRVTDASGAGVSGLQIGLSGPRTLSDATSASGCVLWGYLDAVPGYTIAFSRPPDYVTPSGAQVVSMPVAVVGDQTSNVAVQYDRGGRLQTSFVTRRLGEEPDIPTKPQVAHVTNSGGGGVSVQYPVSGSTGTSGLLFPFTSAYTVQADSCSSSDVPPTPQRPVPEDPPAPSAVAGTVQPGVTTTTGSLRIPSPNIRVKSGASAIAGATVRVTTPCGTVYNRTTIAGGQLDDPGFPYTTLSICATDGVRRDTTVRANRNFNADAFVVLDLTGATSAAGTCP